MLFRSIESGSLSLHPRDCLKKDRGMSKRTGEGTESLAHMEAGRGTEARGSAGAVSESGIKARIEIGKESAAKVEMETDTGNQTETVTGSQSLKRGVTEKETETVKGTGTEGGRGNLTGETTTETERGSETVRETRKESGNETKTKTSGIESGNETKTPGSGEGSAPGAETESVGKTELGTGTGTGTGTKTGTAGIGAEAKKREKIKKMLNTIPQKQVRNLWKWRMTKTNLFFPLDCKLKVLDVHFIHNCKLTPFFYKILLYNLRPFNCS